MFEPLAIYKVRDGEAVLLIRLPLVSTHVKTTACVRRYDKTSICATQLEMDSNRSLNFYSYISHCTVDNNCSIHFAQYAVALYSIWVSDIETDLLQTSGRISDLV